MHLSDFRIPELYLPENAKEIKVKTITSDSRNSSKDCMFIAIKAVSYTHLTLPTKRIV